VNQIRAIETYYAGCRFRSRLEARWAVFFDRFGVEWEYEPQGYRLPSRKWYLPDFRLPRCGTWVEVKGDPEEVRTQWPTLVEAAQNLPCRYRGEYATPGLLVLGPIHDRPASGWGDWCWPLIKPAVNQGWDADGVVGVGFCRYHKNGRPWYLCDTPKPPYYQAIWDSAENDADCHEAYRAARSARFEHGESG
jgi:hypothetical protein